MPLSNELIYMAIPAILVAGLVHGAFGLGFPMVATPLLALFTDVLTAMLITLLPTMAVNISIVSQTGMKQLKEVRQHLIIIPFTLLGTLLGTLLLVNLDPRPFLLLLALATLLYLNQNYFKKVNFDWIRKYPLPAYVTFGLMAGFMAGTVNVMLPVLIILFMEIRLAGAAMILIFNLNFFTGKITQSLVFFQQIQGIAGFLLDSLWLVPVAVIALMIGTKIRKKFDETRYLKVLRAVLWLMSGILILRFIYSYL
ncbi:MAG: TSUP family transporter [Gammaproteobacteria bacterium]|nr:TSUP family transporter [Gammaproteobacteria bacterium]